MTAGSKIAARIEKGLQRAGKRTGSGTFTVTLNRSTGGPTYPGGSGSVTVTPSTVTAVDVGTKTRYSPDDSGSLVPRTVRVLIISGASTAPLIGDTVTLVSGTHVVTAVKPTAPGGTALLYELELAL